MITRCDNQFLLMQYIGDEYYKCLYLYLNLKKYGVLSDSIEVYIQKEKELIQAVYLKYYNCLHIYSHNNSFDVSEFCSYFSSEAISMFYCEKTTAEYILSSANDTIRNNYEATFGWVARIDQIDGKGRYIPQLATDDDFLQIVSMIYDDKDIGRSYDYESLSKQLRERAAEGYTRNYVIKNDGVVIAHACTNAEDDKLAVVAELVVNKKYRRKGYAKDIWRTMCSVLLEEGKEVYSFYYSAESRHIHKTIGFYEVCDWAKMVRINKL